MKPTTLDRRRFLHRLAVPMGLMALILPVVLTGCETDGHFTFAGYTTRPNYDADIKTIYVPTFRMSALRTTPYHGIEQQITRAVIDKIQQVTPFRVVDDPEKADTELLGNVTAVTKSIVNATQLGEVREFELRISVELVWRDLRSGKILSNPAAPQPFDPQQLPVFDPNTPQVPPALEAPRPVVVNAFGRGIPELGESNATARKMAIDQLAVQITSMLEKPWNVRTCQPCEANPVMGQP